MAISKTYKNQVRTLNKSFGGFQLLMELDISNFNPVAKDGLINGRIQKFEITAELIWKTVKRLLDERDGVICASPKGCLKDFFSKGYIDAKLYEALFKVVDDRNLLSHVYQEQMFNQVIRRLPKHYQAIRKCVQVINETLNSNG